MELRKENIGRSKLGIWIPAVAMMSILLIVLILSSATTEKSAESVVNKVSYESVFIPDNVSFAGEKMPTNLFHVREALDRELLSNAYFHSQTIRYIKYAPRYFAIIEPILKEKGIPDDFKYLAVAESGFNPRAVSPANAVGFWQFLKGTAQDYGLEINGEVDERYHIEKATYAACDYLMDAYELYDNWTMVAASYNAGMNGINRQIVRQKTDDYYDLLLADETQRYVFRIVALKLILEHPEKYSFNIAEDEKYPIIETKEIEIDGPVDDFAEFAAEQGLSYRVFKDFNPWLRENNLTNSSRKKYILQIPVLE